jgi:hypothetical protein
MVAQDPRPGLAQLGPRLHCLPLSQRSTSSALIKALRLSQRDSRFTHACRKHTLDLTSSLNARSVGRWISPQKIGLTYGESVKVFAITVRNGKVTNNREYTTRKPWRGPPRWARAPGPNPSRPMPYETILKAATRARGSPNGRRWIGHFGEGVIGPGPPPAGPGGRRLFSLKGLLSGSSASC